MNLASPKTNASNPGRKETTMKSNTARRIASITLLLLATSVVQAEPVGTKTPVLTTSAKTESLETHRFERAVSCKYHQVSPRNFFAVFLFNRPEQQTSLVEVRIVRPATERCKSLSARSGSAATV